MRSRPSGKFVRWSFRKVNWRSGQRKITPHLRQVGLFRVMSSMISQPHARSCRSPSSDPVCTRLHGWKAVCIHHMVVSLPHEGHSSVTDSPRLQPAETWSCIGASQAATRVIVPHVSGHTSKLPPSSAHLNRVINKRSPYEQIHAVGILLLIHWKGTYKHVLIFCTTNQFSFNIYIFLFIYLRWSYRKSWATIFCKVTCFIIDKPNTPP